MKRAATTLTAVLGGIAILFLTAALISPRTVIATPDNPPTGKTGAPPTETTCIECHSDFPENDVDGAIVIGNLPVEYTPGQTYSLGLLVGRLGSARWGFEVTALTSGGAAAGTLSDANPWVGKQSAGGREYIGQTTGEGSDGTYAGTLDATVWGFNWTAPPAGAGTVTFYFAGVACNNDNGEGGDYVYSGSQDTTEGTTTDVKATTWGDIKTIYR